MKHQNLSISELPASSALQTPILIPLEHNVFLVRFPNTKKVVAARGVAKQAVDSGDLHDDSEVFVSSSGSFGLGWAIVSRELNLPMTLVTQPSIEPLLPLFRRMDIDVVIVEEPHPKGGFQQARLDRLKKLASEHPHPFLPHPYDDPKIVEAYEPVAESIADSLGAIPDVLVDVTGSGGSLIGLSRAFRAEQPEVQAIAVDTYGSCLFGRPAGDRDVSGMGNSVMPDILDHSKVDEVHWIPGDQVDASARKLLRERGLFGGPTTGAATHVGLWKGRQCQNSTILCVGADSGWRYKDTVFSEEEGNVDSIPRKVDHPQAARSGRWCYMTWGHRSLEEVTEPEEE